MSRDIAILRDLAARYVDICNQPVQEERRDLWRRHNSLERTRPLVLCNWLATWYEAAESKTECEDPLYRAHETWLRQRLFQDSIGDDQIFEPFITQRASLYSPPHSHWGVPYGRIRGDVPGGSWKNDPPLHNLHDLSMLSAPRHEVNEEATARNVAKLQDAVGDLLEVCVDRAPVWSGWNADISTDLGYIRGIDTFMLDMYDDPEGLHNLVGWMRDGIRRAQDEAESAGDWSLCNHNNQAMCYAKELEGPKANTPCRREDLWVFFSAQEFTLVSPRMHDEFLLQYQISLMSKFGLSAYGCCEDLTEKIDMLRQIPNLRRIGVTPRANVRRSAEQIGEDYVFSWRPNPSEMICCGFDPEHVRKVVRDAMEASKGCHVDITLKDVQTVEHDTSRLRRWVETVRSVTDDYA